MEGHMPVAETLTLQNKAFDEIMQAFQYHQNPAAWLLVGPRGIGKATLVYLVAKEILAHDNAERQRQLSAGTYSNFYVLESASTAEGGMDEARRLIHYLKQTAPLPGWRVVLINCIDELSHNTSNALLKILEEPPSQTLIFLIAHIQSKVLPTLRSRCRCLDLTASTISADQLPTDLQPLLALGPYSLGCLQRLAEAGGISFYEDLGRTMLSAAQGDYPPVTAFVEKISANEPLVALTLEVMEVFFYRFLKSCVSQNGYSWVSEAEKVIFQSLSAKASVSYWLTVQKALNQFLSEAREAHLDRKHLLMACFFIIENPEVVHV